MRGLKILALACTLATPAHTDWKVVEKEWDTVYPHGVPDNVKSWFQSVRSPKGVPCCSEADGHPTEEDWRPDGSTWVPHPLPWHKGEWIRVPDEAIVQNAGNPTSQAIGWWVQRGDMPDGIYWRCFVHGSGV